MSKLLVVIGVTGIQGGSVARVFVKEAGWKVRGITRNATKAADWAAQGVEVVEADLDDKASLVRAFDGAYAVFGTTDFWGPIFDPATKSRLGEGQSINKYAFDLERQRALNIAEAAAETKGLERFITSSLSNANHWTQGRLTHVYHFDSKALVVEHVEKNMPDLAAKMSVLQVGSYMTNFVGPGLRPKKQADGTFRIAQVGKGDTPVPLIFTQRDTGYLVRALLQIAPGKNLLGAGSMLSWKECLKVWCKTQNVPYGGYDEIPLLHYAKGSPMGPDLGLEFGEMFAYIDNPGYDGGDPSVILPEELGVPCPMTSFEDWCRETDFSAILNAKPISK